MSVITDERMVEAKAQAELITALARSGVRHTDLTQFERFIWTAAYKAGHAQGMVDGVEEARVMRSLA